MILIKHKNSAATRRFVLLFSFRVRYQAVEASHLVPETDGGLQERVDHGPDLLLEKWPGPLCPHPQIQASADVRKALAMMSLPARGAATYLCVYKVFMSS